ncbi:MAG: hypothetical protein JO258_16985 [Alphaproteobacteria bacterium]|nr:hypothetical protein [Alphaproteobacteria bacterium]
MGYSLAAQRLGWAAALLTGTLGFLAVAIPLQAAAPPPWVLALTACAALAATLRVLPRPGAVAAVLRVPRWDLPARMIVATGLVLGVTALAPIIGGRPSGLAATYPVFAAVLAAFSHRSRGAGAAVQVLRGLLVGLFAFVGFFAALAASLTHLTLAAAFVAAAFVALAIQGGSLQLMRRRLWPSR